MVSSLASAYEFDNQVTANGVEYVFHQGDKNRPLLITITTDIKESMTDVYSPAGGLLAGKGYNIAAIDVACHGNDLKKHEKYCLDCWRDRADCQTASAQGRMASSPRTWGLTHPPASQICV